MSVVTTSANGSCASACKRDFEPDAAAARARIDVERLADAEAGEIALTDAEIAMLAREYGVEPTEVFGGRITPIRDIAAG